LAVNPAPFSYSYLVIVDAPIPQNKKPSQDPSKTSLNFDAQKVDDTINGDSTASIAQDKSS
jgi:hypothetical protein